MFHTIAETCSSSFCSYLQQNHPFPEELKRRALKKKWRRTVRSRVLISIKSVLTQQTADLDRCRQRHHTAETISQYFLTHSTSSNTWKVQKNADFNRTAQNLRTFWEYPPFPSKKLIGKLWKIKIKLNFFFKESYLVSVIGAGVLVLKMASTSKHSYCPIKIISF